MLGYARCCFDGNGKLSVREVVDGTRRVAAVRAGVVLPEPAVEKAEVAPMHVGWRLQGHHVRVRHDTVEAAVILDRARQPEAYRADAGRACNASAGDQEGEEHHREV